MRLRADPGLTLLALDLDVSVLDENPEAVLLVHERILAECGE